MHDSDTPHVRPRRPVHALVAVVFAVALALAGCSGSGSGSPSSDKGAADARAARPTGTADGAGGEPAAGGGAKKAPSPTAVHIIRTASLSVRVKDVPAALDAARSAAEDAGGMVGDEATDRDTDGRERSRLTLRVPQDAYEKVLDELSGSGHLLERKVTAKDVTDQVVDVNSRVATQRASVARVRELMDKADKLSDVVALEGELSSRESDLESLLAQRDSLKDRTTLATITLDLTGTPAKQAAAGDEDDGPGFLDALTGGWGAFVTALKWVVIVLAAVLPFAALVALLVLVWLRLVRPRRPRRTPSAGPVAPAPGPLPAQPLAPEQSRARERSDGSA